MKKVLLFSCILLLTGCMTQKKQQRIAHAYMSMHPDELAAICASEYPSETKYIKGETITKRDTTRDSIPVIIEVDCPDGSKVKKKLPPKETITIDNSRTDTLEVLPTSIKSQLKNQINQIRDRDIKIVQLESDLIKEMQKTEDAEKLAQRRLFIIISLGALMGIGLFLRFKKTF